MRCLSFICLILFSLFGLSLCLSPQYIHCQLQKPEDESPLTGCPQGTFYVSATDERANFTTIQDAINSLPETGDAFILIGEGEYNEMLDVRRVAPLVLLGQLNSTAGGTSLNLVDIWNALYVEDGLRDYQTATLVVGPPSGESVGSVDFKAYNINFQNRAADYSISQALTTYIMFSNASFYGCTFASFQDTWCTAEDANTYVVNSDLLGETDYIFGTGVAFFQSVTLKNRGCGGAITAWQGCLGTKNGVYISDSYIIRSPDANASTVTNNHCYLGRPLGFTQQHGMTTHEARVARPWNEYATAVFLRNYMDDSINARGYTSWNEEDAIPNTAYYAEYISQGPGGEMSARAPQARNLTEEEAATFTVEEVFDGVTAWIDFDYEY